MDGQGLHAFTLSKLWLAYSIWPMAYGSNPYAIGYRPEAKYGHFASEFFLSSLLLRLQNVGKRFRKIRC